ncbi:BspC domain-containing protein [Trinickia diaoshuihuensis]|jgi:hypothetical protein|uniref:BspC domain-containing protein n=1 Tax=Trinickia diaoshuihuensis TaxID=2292265 RepID=UPI000E2211E0|nr:hypothetical protein [Trinickia diaoshuihuensis]
MDSSKFSRRLRQLAGQLATSAVLALPMIAIAPARADSIDQRNELIAHFVNDMHADPLVADCAAHGSFVASTSTVIDHVDFPPEAFDSAHAEIKPWNQPFDQGKQRITVDNIVTVEGHGIARETSHESYPLTFRCGYVGTQMLAFTWNDPVPPLKAHNEGTSRKKGKRRHGGHATGHTSSNAVKHSTKKKSSAKPAGKH